MTETPTPEPAVPPPAAAADEDLLSDDELESAVGGLARPLIPPQEVGTED